MSRDGVYKSLALTALAQQGKGADVRALASYGEGDLPSPSLGNLAEMRKMCTRLFREAKPTELSFSYDELKSLDDIFVTLLPEKKGVVFKHVEYQVESRNLKSSVRRRYRDFEAFSEVLLYLFPYRLIPRMPPKKIGASTAFIEHRRRSFKRFLLLIVRHPVLAAHSAVKFFLTAPGHEIGSKLKDKFKSAPDEFMFNPMAQNAEELVTDETRIKFDRVREQVLLMHQIVSGMLQIATNMENRSVQLSQDMKAFSGHLSTLANDAVLSSAWTSGSDESWSYMRRDCHQLAGKLKMISDKAHQQGIRETSGYTEGVHLYLDLITAYLDLCERREKVVHRKHQKALAKVQTMVNYKDRMESQGRHLSDKDDSRIIRRDDELIQLEKRNFFSLLCMDLEAQLVHINLAQLSEIFELLVSAQIKGHSEYQTSWEEVRAVVEGMTRGPASPTSSLGSDSLRGHSSSAGAAALPAKSPFV